MTVAHIVTLMMVTIALTIALITLTITELISPTTPNSVGIFVEMVYLWEVQDIVATMET